MTVLDTDILNELASTLIEPETSGASWASGFWTASEVIDYMNRRQRDFLKETLCLISSATLNTIPNVLRHPLPQDWIRTYDTSFRAPAARILVSSWKLEEATGTRFDTFGPNHLTPFNAPGNAVGKIGNAVSLSRAASQALSISDATQTGLNPGFSDFSVSLWINPASNAGSTAYGLVCKGNTNNSGAQCPGFNIFMMGIADSQCLGRIKVTMGGPPSGVTGLYYSATGTPPPLNTWTHIIVTIDRNSVATIYYNGVAGIPLITAGANFTGFENVNHLGDITGNITTAAPFVIGAGSDLAVGILAAQCFDGRIDATQYFNVALSQDQVTELYNSSSGLELYKNGQISPHDTWKPLERSDSFEADLGITDWTYETQPRPDLYSDGDQSTLTMQVMPAANDAGVLEILYVKVSTALSNSGIPFEVPDEFVPAIKWGVLADMLGKIGRAHDPQRANYCESRYREAVEAAKIMLREFI